MDEVHWTQVFIQIIIGAITAAINGTFLLIATRITSKALDKFEKNKTNGNGN